MLIKTKSMLARNGETPTSLECAALAHFFKAEETSSDTFITCDKTGITVASASQTRLPSGFGLNLSVAVDTVPSAALTSPAAATDDIMIVVAGQIAGTGAVSFGQWASGTTDNSIVIGGSVTANGIDDGTAAQFTSGSVTNTESSIVMIADVSSATGLNAYQDSTTTKGAKDITTYNGITLAAKFTAIATSFYGCALFYFPSGGLPSTALADGLWMADQWLLGHKVLHPNCKDWT